MSFDDNLRDAARAYFVPSLTPNLPYRRVIVVTGAGASVSSGLPTGGDAAKELEKQISPPDGYMSRELRSLSRQFRLDKDDFETKLLALTRFHRIELLAKLGDMFSRRFYVSLSYELLAHLMKHHFIDAIINFNFDELLDQAVEDEIGTGNYHKIISDGDIPDEFNREDRTRRPGLQSEWFKVPWLIKPHGTISHQSSLRFTREQYDLLPKSLEYLLECLMYNTPMTIVLVGFGMKSVEFTDIVESVIKDRDDCEVFAIDYTDAPCQEFPDNIQKWLLPAQPNIASVLTELWSTISGLFSGPGGSPRDIHRHKALAALFPNTVDRTRQERERDPRISQYLKDRVFIELAFSIAKARGFVNTSQLILSRPGRYFRYYREEDPSSSETFYEFIRRLRLQNVDYSNDTLRLDDGSGSQFRASDPLVIDREKWPSARQTLINATLDAVSNITRRQIEGNRIAFVCALNYMFDNDEVEVINPRKTPYQHMFTNPIRLSSLAATKVFTDRTLAGTWKQLLCIAESGEWLFKSGVLDRLKEDKSKKLFLIAADRVHKKELQQARKEGACIEMVYMPWWSHNQHMTLACGSEIGGDQGIYFERRLRALLISPVGLTSQTDLEVAKSIFMAYWIKDQRRKKYSREEFIGPDDVELAWRQFGRERGEKSR